MPKLSVQQWQHATLLDADIGCDLLRRTVLVPVAATSLSTAITDTSSASVGTAFFATLPVVSGANVTGVGLTELVCAEAGQDCGEDDREISINPISLALRIPVSFGTADELHGVGGRLFARIEEGAQHIPRQPTGGGLTRPRDRVRRRRTADASDKAATPPSRRQRTTALKPTDGIEGAKGEASP